MLKKHYNEASIECFICKKPGIDVQMMPCCQQFFCKTCLNQALSVKQICPCCKSNATSLKPMPVEGLFNHLYV